MSVSFPGYFPKFKYFISRSVPSSIERGENTPQRVLSVKSWFNKWVWMVKSRCSTEQLNRYKERQHQIELAKARGEEHIGDNAAQIINATFNNMSVMLCRSDLLVLETGIS
jgi:hypothetical protein